MSIQTVVGRLIDTDDDGTGLTGTVRPNAWLQSLQDKVDAVVGDWTAVSFTAGNFTGNGSMTWTLAAGDATRNRYQLVNKTLHWLGVFDTTTVGGTPNTTLQILIPTGTFASTATYQRAAYVNDNGTLRPNARVNVVDGTHLGIDLGDGTNWAASTNATYVYFDIQFELA